MIQSNFIVSNYISKFRYCFLALNLMHLKLIEILYIPNFIDWQLNLSVILSRIRHASVLFKECTYSSFSKKILDH